jgi:TolB-like protein/tetratricopeptide (TPR) repeat protein
MSRSERGPVISDPEVVDDDRPLRQGSVVYGGRYRIDAELGRGGMGRVLRARDLKLGRDVAVKVLARGAGEAKHRLRFEQEARAAGALNHPNIVAVHDIAEHDGTPFIVTELLEGETLRAVLLRGPLAPAEALELAQQLASGLAAAHAKGIVHRDIKPENLFLTDDGRLKILDFGIAKLLEADGGKQTITGTVMGTPGYMSPEQVRGEPADARSDVFAFGSVVHEMLTGAAPFDRGSAVETGYAIVHESAARLPSGTPPQLARVVGRALQKEPASRHADAREVVRELGGASPRFHPRIRLRRRFTLPVAIALALLAAVWLLGKRLVRVRAPSRIESLVVLPLENRSGDPQQEYLADGITAAVIDELARIKSLRVISRTSAMTYKGVKKPLPEIAKELAVDAVVEGSVATANGRMRLSARLIRAADERTLWSKNFEGPLRELSTLQTDLATELTREMNAVLTPEESARLVQKRQVDPAAYDLFLRAQHEFEGHQECDGMARTRTLLERAIAKDPAFADAHAMLANTWTHSSWMTCVDPKTSAPKARAEAQRAIELDASSSMAHVALSNIAYTFDANAERALEEARRAVALNPASNDAWSNLFQRLVLLGHFDEAIGTIQRVAELDPAMATSLSMGLGWAYYFAGRYEEAIAAAGRALAADPTDLYGNVWAAFSWFELGEIAKGREAMEKARAAFRPGRSCLDDTMFAAGLALGGNRKEALGLIVPWEERAKKEYVDAYQLAVTRAQLGDNDRAVRWLEVAWRQHSPSFLAMKMYPVDLEKKAWLGPLKGDPRVAELLKRPRAP